MQWVDYWAARERAEILRVEAKQLDAALRVYAANSRYRVPRRTLKPLEHYDLLNLDIGNKPVDCGCHYCAEWSARQADFVTAMEFVQEGHRWYTCLCATCRFVASVHTTMLAAANRRDVMISMAYNAKRFSKYPNYVMKWLDVEFRQPKYTPIWCAQNIGMIPVRYWLKRCEAVLGPIVSGAVFEGIEIESRPARETTIQASTLVAIMCDRVG